MFHASAPAICWAARTKHIASEESQEPLRLRQWHRAFILFHGKRHPSKMGATQIEAFLTHLAVAGKVAASTQNQAMSALLFLYKEVLGTDLPWLDNIESAKTPKRLPVVLTEDEVKRVLLNLDGTAGLMVRLIYGTGMRIMECQRLRVKDIEFARRVVVIRCFS